LECLTLNKKAPSTFEPSASINQLPWHNIPEDLNLQYNSNFRAKNVQHIILLYYVIADSVNDILGNVMHGMFCMLYSRQSYCIRKVLCVLKWRFFTTLHQAGDSWWETKGILNIFTLISFPSLFSVTVRAIYKTLVFVTQDKLRNIGWMDGWMEVPTIRDNVADVESGYTKCMVC
jgi:hypothetical protein